jgi:CRP-like cAMP-binding protein
MDPVTKMLNDMSPLTPEAIRELETIVQFGYYPKNSEPLKLGQTPHAIYYVSKGLGRVYYLHDGEDITDYFAADGQLIGAVPGAVTGDPSYKAIHLIEDCELYAIDLRELERVCLAHHCIETACRRLMSFALIEEQQRIESLRRFSAAERYHLLEKKYPGLTNRSPLKYIASYLNTSQVSISRIRSGNQ